MKPLRILLASTSFVALASAASAEQATDAGAERLTSAFQAYLTDTPGVVNVTPEGETYTLTVDLNPLAESAQAEGVSGMVSPMSYTLSDLGDGTWKVVQDQPFSFEMTGPNILDYSISFGSLVSEGIWDESLQTFSSYSAVISDYQNTSTIKGPDDAEQSTEQTMDRVVYELTSVAAASGVDIKANFNIEGLRQSMSMPVMPGQPMTINLTSEGYTGTLDASGTRISALMGVAAWFVANPSPDTRVASLDELKGLLQDGLPFFDTTQGNVEMSGVVVNTPVGNFSAEKLAVVVDANGVVEDGRFREAITLAGIELPPGLVPEWAAPLVPTDATFDFEVSRFNLANPAAMILEEMDPSNPDAFGSAFEMKIFSGFAPDGLVDVQILPTQMSNDMYEIRLEGTVSAGPSQMPSGQGKLVAVGLDKVQEALSAAPPEVGMQVLGPLGMATSMAKPGDDGSLVWEIDASQPGQLLINGTNLMP